MKSEDKRVILIIDDERDLVAMLAVRLEREGFAVVTAADGAEGLIKAGVVRHDAVLVDLAMPKADGWEFLEARKARPDLAAVPAVILTAWLTDDLRRRAREAGAAAVRLKPYDENELVWLLRGLCRAPAETKTGG